MSESERKIIFGSQESHQLTLKPESPLSKTSSNDSIMMRVEARAGDFSGKTIAPFTVEMLNHTLHALSEFAKCPDGEFTLCSESREFWASMTGDGGDKIVGYCTLNDCKNRYTRLRFEVQFNKKQVLKNIDCIKHIIALISDLNNA